MDLLFLAGRVLMAVLILVARDMAFMRMVLTGLLLCRHRGVAMTMFVQISRDVSLVIMMGTGFFNRLLRAHELSPVVEDFMFVAVTGVAVGCLLEHREGKVPRFRLSRQHCRNIGKIRLT